MPGYIKNVGDHIRMRWVQSGYDPDATDVPPNKVIFDSDDIGTLSVLSVGSIAVPGGNVGSYQQLVSWNLSFVPLCWLSWEFGGDGYLHNMCSGGNPVLSIYRINIRKTGIWYRGWMNTGQTLHYTVFNANAADG